MELRLQHGRRALASHFDSHERAFALYVADRSVLIEINTLTH
jgi:hypothetical protein